MFAAGLNGQWWILIAVAASGVAGFFITRYRRNKGRDK
jgi:hypothetical protein